MSNDAPTYATEEMRAAQGQWGGTRTAPPITETDIRRWAMATYYPKQPPRIYWDAEYAATTHWGGIVAPPDFNPFAWPVERPRGGSPGLSGRRPDGKPLTGMNGARRTPTAFRCGPATSSARAVTRRLVGARRTPGAYSLRPHRDRMAQSGRRTRSEADVHLDPLLGSRP